MIATLVLDVYPYFPEDVYMNPACPLSDHHSTMGDAGERGVKKAKKRRNLHRRYSHKIDLDNRRLARMHDKVSYFLCNIE